MLGARRVRPDERREAWSAFLLLFGLILGHSILETARDALFLASIPPTRLPWVYIGIAAGSLAVAQAQARFAKKIRGRRALSLWIALAGVVTLLFWVTLDRLGSIGLYVLYIWSGVLTTLVLIHFWTLLGGLFTVPQAKRLYSFIGTGSVLGAIVGSAGASAISSYVDARHLLAVAAAAFFITAIVPSFLRDADRSAEADGDSKDGFVESALFVARHPYARRVAMFVVVSTMALTLGDYVFKATVAREVAAENLGRFFGATYLALNILSLLSQVAVVSYVIRKFDLVTALSILPTLILIGALGFIVFPGVALALVIKGADGSLRHSVHRTSTELMFVPFTDRSRSRVKAFIDVVAQRGGQTIASVAVLALAAANVPLTFLAGGLAVLTGFWVAGAIDIRRHYVDVFRSRVRRGIGTGDFPELDVASLETLVATLDGENEAEVVAALDVLEREGRSRVVPGLILYHPSEEVVVRALALFVREDRKRVLPKITELLEHDTAGVRSAAVAAHAHLGADERTLRTRLSLEDSPDVRAAIMVNLIAMQAIVGSDASDALDNLIRHGSVETRIALAEAIHRRAAASLSNVLVRLADAPEPEVRRAAAQAMAMTPDESFFSPLLELLASEPTERTARQTLLGYGDLAFDRLVASMSSDEVAPAARRRLPRLLCSFERDDLPDTLLAQLVGTEQGDVRFALILALESLVARMPDARFDESLLIQGAEYNVRRAYEYLDLRRTLVEGAQVSESRATEGHALLTQTLLDKQSHATDRALRLLGLLYPQEQFADIRRDAMGDDSTAQSNAIELLDNLLKPPLRAEVIALVDDLPDHERLVSGARLHPTTKLDYDGVLLRLLDGDSEALKDITVFHIGELRLSRFEERLRRIRTDLADKSDVDLTLALLASVDENVRDAR